MAGDDTTRQEHLRYATSLIEAMLDEIKSIFTEPLKATLILRHETDPEFELLLSDDTKEGALEAINRRWDAYEAEPAAQQATGETK